MYKGYIILRTRSFKNSQQTANPSVILNKYGPNLPHSSYLAPGFKLINLSRLHIPLQRSEQYIHVVTVVKHFKFNA